MTDTTDFWPKQPKPDSNIIGNYMIGVSPVGTIPQFDWHDTVISQYANSPVLLQLLDSIFQTVDPTKPLDDFFSLIWNVDTAVGYGLDVWGRIVGVSRVLKLPDPNYLGFEGSDFQPFNQAPFYTGKPATQNYALDDNLYRRLILAKAMANITDCSIPSLNRMLMFLFTNPYRGNAYVVDSGKMAMIYQFEFTPTVVEIAIISQSGVLPKPAGVALSINLNA